jgi:Ankyrin repeats (3 copies)
LPANRLSIKPKVKKNVSFVKQWLSQTLAFKPKFEDKHKARLIYAGWTGDVEMLQNLKGEDWVGLWDAYGISSLTCAVMNLHIKFAETFLVFGHTKSYLSQQRTKHGLSVLQPLHFAAENGDTEMIRLLARSGADITAGCAPRDSGLSEPIHLAASSPNSMEAITTIQGLGGHIMSFGGGMTVMHYAARRPDVVTLVHLKKMLLNPAVAGGPSMKLLGAVMLTS